LNILFFLCHFYVLFSQDDVDLFRFSKHYHGGSARFEAMGGSFGALGADISVVQINPAGMGRFSSSQLSFTPRLTINNTSSSFAQREKNVHQSAFSIPAIGLVLVNDISGNNNGDLYAQFGLGFNKIAYFRQKTAISGRQFPSLLDDFITQAQGIDPNELTSSFPFSTSLAWETYAINYDSVQKSYSSYLNSGDMLMERDIVSKGGLNELFFSYSINRLNRLYYGFSFNIRTYRYEESYTHREELSILEPDFESFTYRYSLNTSGAGFNGKLGIIYLLSEGFRLGLSYHSPTVISLTDRWTADMTSSFKLSGEKNIPSDLVPYGEYKYRMYTPMRTVVSLAGILGMHLAINGDLEYVDYRQAKLRATRDLTYDPYDFTSENKNARDRLTSAFNYRIGLEYTLYQRWFFRLGYASYGGGYKKTQKIDPTVDRSISGGLGCKIGLWSWDLAYVNRQIERYYSPFTSSTLAHTQLTSSHIIFTTSLRF